MSFPQARTYQTHIVQYLVPVPPRARQNHPPVKTSVSQPVAEPPLASRTRVLDADSGTPRHHIDVDEWDALPPIYVQDSDEEDGYVATVNVIEQETRPVHGPDRPEETAPLSGLARSGSREPEGSSVSHQEAATESASDEDIRALFRCPICIDTYSRPIITICMHIFCAKCVLRLRANVCPICRAPFTQPHFRDTLFEDELNSAIDNGVIDPPDDAD